MTMPIDVHTHTLRRDAIVDIDPVDVPLTRLRLLRGYRYSVGIHPWNAGRCTPSHIRILTALAGESSVVAIGETGLDSVHEKHSAPSIGRQTELLDYHIYLSEHFAKPLILHVVRRYEEIMRLYRATHPTQPWIIHGFRGKPALARDLVKCGFHISFGEKFNPASYAVVPPSRRLTETDDSRLPLTYIAAMQRL